MNLEGSLAAFGLRDLFLLLAGTGKTGALWVRRGAPGVEATRGVVWFREGQVVAASGDASRFGLARRLVGVGAVDDIALTAAVDAAAAGEVGLVRALLDADAVEPGLLQEAAAEQTIDAVCELLRWSEGEFSFEIDATDPDEVGSGLPVTEAVLAADARERAWNEVAALIPSPEAVLSLPVSLAEDPVVSRDEWSLLALIDGRRTVNDLVVITGAGQFRVASVLAGLVSRGLVAARDADAHDHASLVERRLALIEAAERALSTAEPEPAPRTSAAPPVALEVDAPAVPAAVRGQSLGARPADRQQVVPPRPEPFLPARAAARPASQPPSRPVPPARPGPHSPLAAGAGGPQVMGSAAVATAPDALVERDPSVNRSLLLRLIAGVRGL